MRSGAIHLFSAARASHRAWHQFFYVHCGTIHTGQHCCQNPSLVHSYLRERTTLALREKFAPCPNIFIPTNTDYTHIHHIINCNTIITMLSRTTTLDRPDGATSFRKRRGSMGSSSSSSSLSLLSSQNMLTRTVVALSATMLLLVVEARPLGFYAWNSDANAAITHNVTTTSDAPPTKRIHHLPGSAMSLLVDTWFDVQEQQHNMTATTTAANTNTNTASATPQAAPTIHNHPSIHQQQRPSASSSSSTSPSSMATTALLEWHECSSSFPVPRIEILSRHAHDNTITFSIEQSSRQQQACQNYHYQTHQNQENDERQSSMMMMNTVSPSLSPPSNNNMRWLATQFQNSRGNWICATQETAACRKRFIYTASCPTTTHPNELSWARVALYLADDDSLPLRRPNDDEETAVADTCTAIRNSVESSRAQRQQHQQPHHHHHHQHRRPSRGQTCAFHFQLPCQPITASASVTQSSSSWSSTTSSTTMSAI